MTEFEQRHGKVDMTVSRAPAYTHDIHGRPLPTNRGAHVAAATQLTAASSQTFGNNNGVLVTAAAPSTSPLRTYAEWYLAHSTAETPLHTVPTVEHFKRESAAAGRREEAFLWSLMEDIYADAEQADQYHPDAIGIEAVQPHRRWFISQYAHLQAFLQRQPVLRRANLICRWLESTYRSEARQEPRLRGEEEVVLRQLILTYLRGGELHRAIQAAVTYRSCVHSCVLSAAQLQTVEEPWFAQTALVPLFGEYAHGELDQAWCGNEHRLENLSQLYTESLKYRTSSPAAAAATGNGAASAHHGSSDFDAVIGATLCGNLSVLESAFAVNGSWKDMVWCYLRCALVVAFTKQLMTAAGAHAEGGDFTGGDGRPDVERDYAVFVEGMTGSGDDWVVEFSQKLVQGLASRLQAGCLTNAPLAEQLQMRFILQSLTCMDGRAAVLPTLQAEWFDILPEEGNSEAARLVTHVVLAQDVAFRETLSPHSVQVRAGASLATSLARYAVFLALLPRYPFDEGLRAVTAMTRQLRDARQRAGVYAAFIRAAREYELERHDLSRAQLEEQEGRLVRQFVTADPDSQVHAEVQQLLYQQVAPTAMLTHNKAAERILWESMHADSIADYVHVLRGGLTACCGFWLAQPTPEVEAIADVSSILTRRVLVELQRCGGEAAEDGEEAGASTSPVTDLERSEATFWYVLSEARGVAKRHATSAAELRAARGNAAFDAAAAAVSSNRTLVYQLTQDEAALLHTLVGLTQQAVRHGGAVVHRDAQCLSAILWLVRQLTEEVTLSMLSSGSLKDAEREAEEEGPAAHDELSRMQAVHGLLEELLQAGYLEPSLLTAQCAGGLYTQIRAMRVAYGQQLHRRHVVAALRARSARQAGKAVSDVEA